MSSSYIRGGDEDLFGASDEHLGSGSQFATQGDWAQFPFLDDKDLEDGGLEGDDGPTGQQELPQGHVAHFSNLAPCPPPPGKPLLPVQPRRRTNGGEDIADDWGRIPTMETVEAPRRPRRQPQSRQGSDSKAPILACPFYKSDPRRYHDCRTFVLRRVKDIKQHINRKHQLPDIYCSRCYQEFQSAEQSAQHQRGQATNPCTPRDMPGITDQQREQFSRYRSRGKEIQEQWYDLWNIVFPNREKPESIYINTHREARVRMLRKIWHVRKSEIIRSSLHPDNSKMPENLDSAVIDRVVDTFLKHVETDMDVEETESDRTLSTGELPPTPAAQPQEQLEGGKESRVLDEEHEISDPYASDAFLFPQSPDMQVWSSGDFHTDNDLSYPLPSFPLE